MYITLSTVHNGRTQWLASNYTHTVSVCTVHMYCQVHTWVAASQNQKKWCNSGAHSAANTALNKYVHKSLQNILSTIYSV